MGDLLQALTKREMLRGTVVRNAGLEKLLRWDLALGVLLVHGKRSIGEDVLPTELVSRAEMKFTEIGLQYPQIIHFCWGFSLINQPFCGSPIYGNTQMKVTVILRCFVKSSCRSLRLSMLYQSGKVKPLKLFRPELPAGTPK